MKSENMPFLVHARLQRTNYRLISSDTINAHFSKIFSLLSYRAEYLLRLLDDRDPGPLEPLEDSHPRGVVDGRGGVRAEERRKPVSGTKRQRGDVKTGFHLSSCV